MNELTQTRDARNAVLSRLERSSSERTELIDAVTEATDTDRKFIEDIDDQLEGSGEIYESVVDTSNTTRAASSRR